MKRDFAPKPNPLLSVCLGAVFLSACVLSCVAQTAPQPESSNASQSAQPPASGDSQATAHESPAAKPSASQSTPPVEVRNQGGHDQSSATSNDRLFFALPNFLTVENAGQVPPLKARQKFAVVARSSFDPVQIVWYGFLAGVSQAETSEPGYGEGAQGYGKRYGAYFADTTIESFFTGAILPALLHQDPRFFQSGRGSFMHRTGYAVSRIVITPDDSGRSQFNFSEVFGSAIASAVSTYSYHPRSFRTVENGKLEFHESDRTLKNAASVWGSQVGYDTITLVVKEFWPDIRRKLRKPAH